MAASAYTVVQSLRGAAQQQWQRFLLELAEFRADVKSEAAQIWRHVAGDDKGVWASLQRATRSVSYEGDNVVSLLVLLWWAYGLMQLALSPRAANYRRLHLFDFRGTHYVLQFIVNLAVALVPEVLVAPLPLGWLPVLSTRIGLHAVYSLATFVISFSVFVARILYLQWRFERSKRDWARRRGGTAGGLRKVAIFHASIGAGHKRAAQAVAEALQLRDPTLEVKVCDMLAFTDDTLIAKKGYMRFIQYRLGATLYGWFFEEANKASAGTNERGWVATFVAKVQRAFFGSFYEFLFTFQPDMVISTHFLPTDLIGQLQDSSDYDVPHISVVTDFDAHRVWANMPCTQYFAPREEASLMLQWAGVPADIVQLCGIPIVPAFSAQSPTQQCRRELGLDPKLPVVVQMSGGRDVFGIYKQLLSAKTPMQVVVITGRQADVRSQLEKIPVPPRHMVKLEGFTTRMHDYMTAADLLLSKPGGLTTAEAMATETPLVVVNPIPGQETRNTDMLLEEGAAIKINDLPLLAFHIDRVLGDPNKLARMKARARALGDPHAAFSIADWVLAFGGGSDGKTADDEAKESSGEGEDGGSGSDAASGEGEDGGNGSDAASGEGEDGGSGSDAATGQGEDEDNGSDATSGDEADDHDDNASEERKASGDDDDETDGGSDSAGGDNAGDATKSSSDDGASADSTKDVEVEATPAPVVRRRSTRRGRADGLDVARPTAASTRRASLTRQRSSSRKKQVAAARTGRKVDKPSSTRSGASSARGTTRARAAAAAPIRRSSRLRARAARK